MMRVNKRQLLIFAICLGWLCVVDDDLQAVQKQVVKHFNVRVKLFSIQPQSPIDSYRVHGAGSTAGGQLGLACRDAGRYFSVSIIPLKWQTELELEVRIKPDKSDQLTVAETLKVDLTELQPAQFDIAVNDDGRIYSLNLIPEVLIVDRMPKPATIKALGVYTWTLSDAAVVVNDLHYAGRPSANGGVLAYIDIPGLYKIEFAMSPFRNAKPTGVLEAGRLHFELDKETTIDLYNVKNGYQEKAQILPGGPYQVWTRVTPSTAEDIPDEDTFVATVTSLLKSQGKEATSEEQLRKTYRTQYEGRKYFVAGSGVMGIPKKDRIKQE